MNATKHGRTSAEMTGQRDGSSSLQRAIDLAIEREKLRMAEAHRHEAQADRRERDPHLSHAHAALARAMSSDLCSPRGTSSRAGRAVHLPYRSGSPTQLELNGHSSASEVRVWLKIGAVALGVTIIALALWIPVSEPAPASPFEPQSTGELGNVPGVRAGVAHDDRARGSTDGPIGPSGGMPLRSTGDFEPGYPAREPASRGAAVRSPSPAEQTASRAPARGPQGARAVPSSTPAGGERAKLTMALAPPSARFADFAERPQRGTAAAKPGDGSVTVHDLFGIGGDQPVPPEALDASDVASRSPSARASERERSNPPSSRILRGSPY